MELNDYTIYLMLAAVIAAYLIIGIFFVLTLQNTLKAIEPQNRTMLPHKVWWILIPFFNVVWIFYVIAAIADSGRNQLNEYGMISEERPTYTLGIAWMLCSLLGRLPVVGEILSIASLILFVAYWVKVNALRKQILLLRDTFKNEDEPSIFR